MCILCWAKPCPFMPTPKCPNEAAVLTTISHLALLLARNVLWFCCKSWNYPMIITLLYHSIFNQIAYVIECGDAMRPFIHFVYMGIYHSCVSYFCFVFGGISLQHGPYHSSLNWRMSSSVQHVWFCYQSINASHCRSLLVSSRRKQSKSYWCHDTSPSVFLYPVSYSGDFMN